jgi:hypothetical protein
LVVFAAIRASVTLHCNTPVRNSAASARIFSNGGKKLGEAEISSLDVQRERAMLPGNKMFLGILRDLFPGDAGSSKMFGETNT